jgi:hypothetical protein
MDQHIKVVLKITGGSDQIGKESDLKLSSRVHGNSKIESKCNLLRRKKQDNYNLSSYSDRGVIWSFRPFRFLMSATIIPACVVASCGSLFNISQ